MRQAPRRWLVTGAAGFIGSHLLETLLELGQTVRGLDNFSTGHRHNLAQVRERVGEQAWRRFTLIEGDIRDAQACARACAGVDIVLHQAALGSVPRSISDPQLCYRGQSERFPVHAGRGARGRRRALRVCLVQRRVWRPSGLAESGTAIGEPLSPYALSKHADELYAQLYGRCYGTEAVGLRYFNVFGPRQDPLGAYAAVIPRWLAAMLAGEPVRINGDGSTSRDFCYVANAVQANLLAATSIHPQAVNEVFNVAVNGRTSLLQLHAAMQALVLEARPGLRLPAPLHGDFRAGDVRHSQADICRATRLLGYAPTHDLRQGLRQTVAWYAAQEVAAPADGLPL